MYTDLAHLNLKQQAKPAKYAKLENIHKHKYINK